MGMQAAVRVHADHDSAGGGSGPIGENTERFNNAASHGFGGAYRNADRDGVAGDQIDEVRNIAAGVDQVARSSVRTEPGEDQGTRFDGCPRTQRGQLRGRSDERSAGVHGKRIRRNSWNRRIRSHDRHRGEQLGDRRTAAGTDRQDVEHGGTEIDEPLQQYVKGNTTRTSPFATRIRDGDAKRS